MNFNLVWKYRGDFLKKTIIILSVLVVIGIASMYFYGENKEKKEDKEVARNAIEHFLYQDKEYKKDDIKSIKLKYDGKATGINNKWVAYVVYSDEPSNEYIYHIRKKVRK